MDSFDLLSFMRLWFEMAVRWFHVVAGIAWIGSSFYFIALDFSLKARDGLPDKAHGEAWQVHGGGFYHLVKYLVAPARLPDELTWFKWESYATWLSGFLLLALVYYTQAELYLIDPAVYALQPIQAIYWSLGGLVAGWLIYDGLCRSPLGAEPWRLGLSGFAFLVMAAHGFTQIFSGRGAMMEMGALIGTIMSANVFAIIIPGQTKVVDDLKAGRSPDPAIGKRAKQRSLHNNYLTLPVVFVMIGNHYPLFFATRWNWIIFGIVLVMGALIRHFFNVRHQGRQAPYWTLILTAFFGVVLLAFSWAGSKLPELAGLPPGTNVALATSAEEVIATRCVVCHAANPAWANVAVPPKGVRFDDRDLIRQHRGKIGEWAVATHAMPPANVSDITEDERVILAQWVAAGDRIGKAP
jgi:uncharacterized membrane protein